jgi:hypothetical protein
MSGLDLLIPQVPAIEFLDDETADNPASAEAVSVLDGAYEIVVPDSWKGRYVIKTYDYRADWWESCVTFFSKKCFEADEGSGELCSIVFAFDRSMVSGHPYAAEIGTWNNGFILITRPTDVPFDYTKPGLPEEYMPMYDDVGELTVRQATR